MASTDFDPGSALGAALDGLALLEQSTDQVEIRGANLNQDLQAGVTLDDEVDIYWSLPGKPGLFTTRVPFVQNWTAIAFYYIGVKQAIVRGIYDGLPNKAALPPGPIGQPVPQPGVPF